MSVQESEVGRRQCVRDRCVAISWAGGAIGRVTDGVVNGYFSGWRRDWLPAFGFERFRLVQVLGNKIPILPLALMLKMSLIINSPNMTYFWA